MTEIRSYRAPATRVPGNTAAAVVALLLLAACSTAPSPRPSPSPRPEPASRDGGPASPLAARIVATAYTLLDAPYRYSGADPGGFDCSGLTHYLYAAAGLRLPRTAAEQARAGRWIALDELAAGDLVFFAKRDKPNHVGLVVSAPGEPLRMIHASTSGGVVEIEVLRDGYWLPRLRFGRRVLPGG